MKATLDWLSASGAEFSAGTGVTGQLHLKHYSATWSEWGEGPPLVLIPGLAGGYELLGPLARILSRDFRVISYQLRGEEDPFALRQRFGLSELVDDLQELLEALRLECPLLMGVSFGGLLALEYASRNPYRISQLVLQGVGARYERSLVQRVAGAVLSNYPLPTDNAFVNQFFNLLFGGRSRQNELFQFVTKQCWQTDQSVMAHRFHLVEKFNVQRRLPGIHAPTLILSGEKDILVSEKSLGALTNVLPKSEHVSLPDCGHLAFATHPHQVADEVRRFAS